jgi:hypothetical protein
MEKWRHVAAQGGCFSPMVSRLCSDGDYVQEHPLSGKEDDDGEDLPFIVILNILSLSHPAIRVLSHSGSIPLNLQDNLNITFLTLFFICPIIYSKYEKSNKNCFNLKLVLFF